MLHWLFLTTYSSSGQSEQLVVINSSNFSGLMSSLETGWAIAGMLSLSESDCAVTSLTIGAEIGKLEESGGGGVGQVRGSEW